MKKRKAPRPKGVKPDNDPAITLLLAVIRQACDDLCCELAIAEEAEQFLMSDELLKQMLERINADESTNF